MPNPFEALLSGSESEGEGGDQKRPVAKKKPVNPAVELAKSRNPTAQPTSNKSKTAETEKQTPTTAGKSASSKPTASRAPVKTPTTAPPVTDMAVKEKELKTRDFKNDNREHQHTRSGNYRGGRGGGRGGGNGGGNGVGGNRPPKREFERHSGTGRLKNEVKRDGKGAHNWGDAKDTAEVDQVLAEVEKNNQINSGDAGVPTAEEPAPETKAAEDAAGEEGAAATEEEGAKPEPEKPTFTMEEYLAQKSEKRRGVAFKQLEEAEVADVSEGRAYAKKDSKAADTEDAYFVGAKVAQTGSNNIKKPVPKDKKAATQQVETGFFIKKQDGKEQRGGRGGGFRGRGRGDFRGGQRGTGERRQFAPRQRDSAVVDTNSIAAFPQLSAA